MSQAGSKKELMANGPVIGDDIYEVEELVDVKKNGDTWMFKVRWRGYGPSGDTWEPESNLYSCQEVMNALKNKYEKHKAKRRSKGSGRKRKEQSSILPSSDESSSSAVQDEWVSSGTSPSQQSSSKTESQAGQLKDTFWEDLETGKIDLFVWDMYTRVKTRSAKTASQNKTASQAEKPTCTKPTTSVKKSCIEDNQLVLEHMANGVKLKPIKVRITGLSSGPVMVRSVSQLTSETRVTLDNNGTDSPVHRHCTDSANTNCSKKHKRVSDDSLSSCSVAFGDTKRDSADGSNSLANVTANNNNDKVDENFNIEVSGKEKQQCEKRNSYSEQCKSSEVATNSKLYSLLKDPRPWGKASLKQQKDESPMDQKDWASSSSNTSMPLKMKLDENLNSNKSVNRVDSAVGSEITKKHHFSKTSLLKDSSNQMQSVQPPFQPLVQFDDFKHEESVEMEFTSSPPEPHPIADTSVGSYSKEIRTLYNSKPDNNDLITRTLSEINSGISTQAKDIAEESQLCMEHESDNSLDLSVPDCLKGLPDLDVPMGLDLNELTAMEEWNPLDSRFESEKGKEVFESPELSPGFLLGLVKKGEYEKLKQALNSRHLYNLEQTDTHGFTLLMVASACGYEDIVELLILHGANINAQDKMGTTSLMLACEKGHDNVVSTLLEFGAAKDLQGPRGETALMIACREGLCEIVQMLLNHGANFAAVNHHSMNALRIARMTNHAAIQYMLAGHISQVTAVFEAQVTATVNNTAEIIHAHFPLHCFSLSEGPSFRITFNHHRQLLRPGTGSLLFVGHARITPSEIRCRFRGPCAVSSVTVNGIKQDPLTEGTNFIFRFAPLREGVNEVVIETSHVPTAYVKLLVCAYNAQLIHLPS